MENLKLNGAVFGIENNCKYAIRNMCAEFGIELAYLDNLHSLLFYIISNPVGIIFLGKKYSRFSTMLTEITRDSLKNSYVVICFDDNACNELENGKNNYVVNSIEQLDNILPKVKSLLRIKMNSNVNVPQKDIYKYTASLLSKFRIPCKLLGYSYIRDCVSTAIFSCNRSLFFNKSIYPLVALNNNTTTSNIEKNIRMAIKKARHSSPDVFEIEEFKNKKISNAEFLTYLIEKTKLMYLED